MLVTIFTDAGLCPETGAASWGSWAKSERGVSRGGGILKDLYNNSTAAEAAAAMNGVHNALANGIAKEGDTLLVQSDNDGIQNFLNGVAKGYIKQKVQRTKLHAAFLAVRSKYKLVIRFRHVRGHQGTKDKRSAVNTWCDTTCTFFLAWGRHYAKPEKWPEPQKPIPYGVKI